MKNKILLLLLALIFAGGGFGLATYLFKTSDDSAASIEDSVVRTVYLEDAMRAAGLRVDRVLLAKKADKATIYASFLQPFSGLVMLKAYDRTGAEIGRSRRTIAGKTDEAMYADFEFDSNVPLKLAESFRLVYATELPVVEETVEAVPEIVPEVPATVSEEAPLPEPQAETPAENAAEENATPSEV